MVEEVWEVNLKQLYFLSFKSGFQSKFSVRINRLRTSLNRKSLGDIRLVLCLRRCSRI